MFLPAMQCILFGGVNGLVILFAWVGNFFPPKKKKLSMADVEKMLFCINFVALCLVMRGFVLICDVFEIDFELINHVTHCSCDSLFQKMCPLRMTFWKSILIKLKNQEFFKIWILGSFVNPLTPVPATTSRDEPWLFLFL